MSYEFNNGDEPASPIFNSDGEYTRGSGLSKREAFAMAAMQAILSNPSLVDICSDDAVDFISYNSVRITNSVLAELAKEKAE